MVRNTKQHIFFVDDEPMICKVVGKTLEKLGPEAKVSCFASATDCLEQLRLQTCDLLITDEKMPEMTGSELLEEVRGSAPWVPVLLITGYGDISLAVSAMKAGAEDFIEKPLEKGSFLNTVKKILKQNAPADSYKGKPLTKIETKVLKLIAEGYSNKKTARLLNRHIRTVEEHRKNIMRKLGVRNVVELIKRAIQMGLIELPVNPKRAKRAKGRSNAKKTVLKRKKAPRKKRENENA